MRRFILGLILVAGCGGSDDNSCGGEVDGIHSTGTGAFTASGTFKGGQLLVQLQLPSGPMIYPAKDDTYESTDFGDLPSGTFAAHWLLSCDDDTGQIPIDGPAAVTID